MFTIQYDLCIKR